MKRPTSAAVAAARGTEGICATAAIPVAPTRTVRHITSPARGTLPRTAMRRAAPAAPEANPATIQPMPAAPQPRCSESRISPRLSGPTKPSSLRPMTIISGPSRGWRRMYRRPSTRSCRAVGFCSVPVGASSVPVGFSPVTVGFSSAPVRSPWSPATVPPCFTGPGSGLIRRLRSSGRERAKSAPAVAKASTGPPVATATPPSGAPTIDAPRAASPRRPWIRASWPGGLIRGGRAPTAGRNRASTAPKSRATATRTPTVGAVRTRVAASPRTRTARAASLPMTTRRGPSRSASTPPPSIRSARGIEPAARTRPVPEALPVRAAAQARAMK